MTRGGPWCVEPDRHRPLRWMISRLKIDGRWFSPVASYLLITVKPAILFDLDRTLIDVQTFTDYAAAAMAVEHRIGAWGDLATPPTDWDAPTHHCMEVLVALSGDERWSEVSAVIERYERAAVEFSRAMPGLDEAMARTSSLRRAVVTLLPEDTARAALERHRVAIEVLVGRNPVHRPKPRPDQLVAAMRLIGASPTDTVMIGDSSWDAEAAAAANCRFVGVLNGGSPGFAAGTETAPDLGRALDRLGVQR